MYHYLICHKCRAMRVPFAAIEKAIAEWVDDLCNGGNEKLIEQVEVVDDPTPELQAELQKVNRAKSRLIDLYTQDLIEVAEYRKRLLEFGVKEAELTTRVDNWQQAQQQTQQNREHVLTVVDILRNINDALSTAELNMLYRSILRVNCWPEKKLTVQLLS